MVRVLISVFFGCLLLFFSSWSPQVKLAKAYSQRSVGGANGSPQLIQYFFDLRYNGKQPLNADSIWVGEKGLGLSLLKKKSCTYTFYAKESLMGEEMKKQMQEFLPFSSKPPQQYQGQALVRYFIGEKKYFLSIQTFQQKPVIHYN